MPRTAFIEKTIWNIEKFQVKIMQCGNDVRGDKFISAQYIAGKMSKNSFTVGQWKEKFKCQFPGYDVIVLNGDGTEAHGATLLCTVRDTYKQINN